MGQKRPKRATKMVKKGPGPQKSQPRPKSGKNGQKWPTIAKLGKNSINTRLCQNGKWTDFQKNFKNG